MFASPSTPRAPPSRTSSGSASPVSQSSPSAPLSAPPSTQASSGSASTSSTPFVTPRGVDTKLYSEDPKWNWTKYETDDGEFYYFNRQTHETTWKRPLTREENKDSWCYACSNACPRNYYNASSGEFQQEQPGGNELGKFLDAKPIPKVKPIFSSTTAASSRGRSGASSSGSGSSSSGSSSATKATGAATLQSPQQTGTYGGGIANNYGKNQNGSAGIDPADWPTNQQELCAWIAAQPEATQPQQNTSYKNITQSATIFEGVIEQVNVYRTIGDGTCMLHAILTVICPEYRALNDVNKGIIGNRFRKEKFALLPPWDDSGKDETMETSGPYIGENIYSRGINPTISSQEAYLTDADANVFCKFFNINLIIFSDSSSVVAATNTNGGQHNQPGMNLKGPNNEQLPYYFIYCRNPGHYSAMSLKPKNGNEPAQDEFYIPYNVNGFIANKAQQSKTRQEAIAYLKSLGVYDTPNEQSWIYIYYNTGNRAIINVGNVCTFEEGDQITLNGKQYTVLHRRSNDLATDCKDYTLINNVPPYFIYQDIPAVQIQQNPTKNGKWTYEQILDHFLPSASNKVQLLITLPPTGNAEIKTVLINEMNPTPTPSNVLSGGKRQKKSRRNRNKSKKSKKTRRSQKN